MEDPSGRTHQLVTVEKGQVLCRCGYSTRRGANGEIPGNVSAWHSRTDCGACLGIYRLPRLYWSRKG